MENPPAKRRKTSPSPSDPVNHDEVLNPFARGGMRRSPLPGGQLVAELATSQPGIPPSSASAQESQAELPSSPPVALHSSPSVRPRRSRALAELIGTSPTKQRTVNSLTETPGRYQQQKGQEEEGEPVQGQRKDAPSRPRRKRSPPLESRPTKTSAKQAKRPKSRARLSDVRGIRPLDATAETNSVSEALLADIVQLQADLKILQQENERIRQSRLSGNPFSAPDNLHEISDLLVKHLVKPHQNTKSNDAAARSWTRVALNPVSFLPFSKPSSILPTLFPRGDTPPEPPKRPKSYEPLPFNEEIDLLFLKAFTPLDFKSNIIAIPRTEDDGPGPLLQYHTITAASATTPGLFSARIEMTVDPLTHTIVELSVPSIYPSSAASELAPLMCKIIPNPESGFYSSALYHNVSILTWGMGSWLRSALRRAKIWRTLDRELGSLEAIRETVERVRSRRGRKRKAGRDKPDEDDEEDDDASNSASVEKLDGLGDLLPYLDRMWMDIQIPNFGAAASEQVTASLRIKWKIELDWTGEASSRVRALVNLPGKWHRGDDRGKLSNIPVLFDKLLQQDGKANVASAVRTIVALLAGESR